MQQHSTNFNPYEFAILHDGGGWYQYVIRIARTREAIAGGICKTRKKAEQEARQRIVILTAFQSGGPVS
jgi:hypothetical protein